MATFDKKHQEQRQQIMTTHFDDGRTHHFRAGLRSLVHGVFGGIASIPQQAIVGARDEGVVVCCIHLVILELLLFCCAKNAVNPVKNGTYLYHVALLHHHSFAFFVSYRNYFRHHSKTLNSLMCADVPLRN